MNSLGLRFEEPQGTTIAPGGSCRLARGSPFRDASSQICHRPSAFGNRKLVLGAPLSRTNRQHKKDADQRGQHIRPHIRFFLDREQVVDLAQAIRGDDQVQILSALSGG